MRSWFRKNDKDQNPENESSTSHERPSPRDDHDEVVTERTQLLGQNVEAEVQPSPYNRVVYTPKQIYLIAGIFLTFVTVVWWIVLFVSVFVNVPGLYTRGSGFTELAYAFITIFALINSVIFFATPLPRGVRALSLTLSALLFFNALAILFAPPLRHYEGWVGIATVLWAAVIGGIWTVFTDRVVEWGKAAEEERLIGRVEERYTGTEWLKVTLATFCLVFVVVVEILITMTLILRLWDASLEPMGHKYWVQSHRFQVHVACFGNASSSMPLVFLEGGEGTAEYFSTWAAEAQDEGLIGQYCYWDRPGYAFSDNAPSPMSAGTAIDALSAALPKANITEKASPGWILVSHGVGGLYSRVFAARHISQVKGLLLVDTVHESLIPKIFSPGKTFLLLLRGAISPLGVDRLAGWVFRHRSRQDRVWGVSALQSDRVIKSQLQESLAAGTITQNEVIAANAIIPNNIPVAVVSSGKECKNKDWEEGQRELSGKGKHKIWDVVGKAGHEVWKNEEGKKVLKKRLAEMVQAVRA